MTRTEENANFVKQAEQAGTKGTIEEGKLFFLKIASSALVDISKSLAIIADSMREADNDKVN